MEVPSLARKSPLVVLLVRAKLGSAGNLVEPRGKFLPCFPAEEKFHSTIKPLKYPVEFLLAYLCKPCIFS
jgi:hypothetical protein